MVTTAPAPVDNAPGTVPLMGLDFAALSEEGTINYVLESVEQRRGGWVSTVNLDVLRQCRESEHVRQVVANADLVVADGMPLLWAGELQGSPFPGRVAGSSLIVSLSAEAADAGASVFLLGGSPGTADAAVDELTKASPHLRLAGTLCPPFGFHRDPGWLERIEQTLRDKAPDIVYVGLGFPKQERLIIELRARFPSMWFVACGAAFTFVAGEIPRAPAIMQRLGFEWLYRMAHEPKRLYKRYLVQGIPFLFELLYSAAAFRFRHAVREAR